MKNNTEVIEFEKYFNKVPDELITPDWLYKNLIEKNSLNVMFGATGSMKSFVILDMLLHITNNKDWQNFKLKEQDVVALYVAGEGQTGLNLRIKAACNKHELNHDNLLISKTPVDLMNEGHINKLIAAIKSIDKHVFIIFDTLNRNFSGDENSSKDMAVVWQNVTRLTKVNATVMIIHHTGHGVSNRARGSSSIRAAMDGEFGVELNKETKVITVSNTKAKNTEEADAITLTYEKVILGKDEDDDDITSLALLPYIDEDSNDTEEVLINTAELIKDKLPMSHKDINKLIADVFNKAEETVRKSIKPKVYAYLKDKYNIQSAKSGWVL